MSSAVARRPRAVSYDHDPHAWALEQARLLRAGRFDEMDIENIAEEIDRVGGSIRSELETRLATLIEHLLKLAAPTSPGSRLGWRNTVRRSRVGIRKTLRANPSLRRDFASMLADAHGETARFTADVLEDHGEADAAAHVRGREGAGFTDDELFGDWIPNPASRE